MPILEAIEGRFEDVCVTADGRELSRFDTVFKGITSIREAQVVQERLDLFRVCVVPSSDFSERDIEQLKRNMRLHVGDTPTEVVTVDAIERSPSGKFRAVICRVDGDVRRETIRRAQARRSPR
jgi:phenylacetate-CoA ligase